MLVRRLGRRWVTVTYIAFLIVSLVTLTGLGASLWRNALVPAIPQASLIEKQPVKPPEPNSKIATSALPEKIRTEISATLDTTEVKWGKQSDGMWTVQALVHVSSKFQRSGLVLHFKSNAIADVPQPLQLIPINGQPTYHGKYLAKDWSYSHYIQRPWGQYALSLRMKDQSDVIFTYRFEGENEALHVTWKASKL